MSVQTLSDNFYSRQYLKDTLGMISDNLKELSDWSANNNDEKSDEIAQVRGLFDLLKNQLSK